MEECEAGYAAYVGVLSYRTRWQGNDLAVERALKTALNRRGVGVINAFSTGNPDPGLGCLSMEQAIKQFFTKDGKPLIELLVNFLCALPPRCRAELRCVGIAGDDRACVPRWLGKPQDA